MHEPDDRDPAVDPWRDAYRRLQTEGSSSCPDREILVAAALGELEAGRSIEVADHVVSCKSCTATYRDALDLIEETGAMVTPARPARFARSFVRRRGALAAAAALAAVAVGLTLTVRWLGVQEQNIPGPERGGVTDKAETEPPDRARLTSPPDRLVWPADEGAEAYWVVLYDEASTPIWRSQDLREPSVDLPEDARAALRPGQTCYWRVFHRRGLEVRQSDLRRFDLVW